MIRNYILLLAPVLLVESLAHAQNAPFSNLRPGLASSTSAGSVAAAAAVDPASASTSVFSPATALMVANTARSLAPSSNSAVNQQSITGTAFSVAAATLVANRARTLGDKPDGSGTRYFALSDVDLKNLTPQQELQRLSPPPISGDSVRKLAIYVDLKDPLVLQVRPGQSVDIGSAEIKAQGGIQNIEVNASIFLNGVTIVQK